MALLKWGLMLPMLKLSLGTSQFWRKPWEILAWQAMQPASIYKMGETGHSTTNHLRSLLTKMRKVHSRISGNNVRSLSSLAAMLPGTWSLQWLSLKAMLSIGLRVRCYVRQRVDWSGALFGHWIKKLFIPSIPRACPVLLLIDSHSSHNDPGIIRMAAEDGIIVLALPPHLTHYLQPLDLSISSIHGSCIGHRYVTPTSKKILVGSSQSISSAHCFQKCKLSDHRMSFQASVKLVYSPLTTM